MLDHSHTPVRMNDTFEQVLDEEKHEISGLMIRDGVYYGKMPVSGGGSPFLVALHGVVNHIQAARAWEVLCLNISGQPKSSEACSG